MNAALTPLPRRRPLPVLLFLLLGLGTVFFLPYHVPVPPAISDSYVFGFNNRAALALFLTFVAVFAYWSGGIGLIASTPEEPAAAPPLSRRLLWITLLITAVVTTAFSTAYRSIGAINEGAYLMDRLQQLAAGREIYRQFEFIYGPTMLYLPLLLSRCLRIPLLDGYYLAWTLAWVGGTALLWLTVAWGCQTSPRKNGIYLLAFLGFIFSAVSLGLNYTPLRFVAAPFFAVLTWRMLKHRSSALPGAWTALAGSSWVLFYSPEQGFAFVLGTLSFFLLFVERTRRDYLQAILLLIAGEGLLAFALLRTGVAHYVRGMASGGYNLPLLPSLNTLVLLGLLIAAGCVLMNTIRLRRQGGSIEYLILVSLFAMPAAFGRCDPGHLLMNTLGAYLAAWTVISYRAAAGRWMAWSYVASALFLPLALYQANNFFMFPVKSALFSASNPHPGLRSRVLRLMEQTAGTRKTEALLLKWKEKYPVTQQSNVPTERTMLAPLGYPSTLLLGNLPLITNGRYRGLGNVMAEYEVAEKVDELHDNPQELLLFTTDSKCPKASPEAPSPAEWAADDHAARRELLLNLQPFYLPHMRHQDRLLAPVCAYVEAHYRLTSYVGPFVGSEVWERIPTPSPVAAIPR